MTARPDNPKAPLRDRAPFRHAASAAVTLALNAAVVLLLVTWAGRDRPEGSSPIRAVPLSVVPAEPEPLDVLSPQPPAEPDRVQPETPPALPPLPRPALSPSSPRLDAPAPMEMAVTRRMDVPAFAAETASPVVVGPTGLPARPPVRPAPARPGRPSGTYGPALVSQPDLSDYYPRRALLRGVTGRTRIRLTVDALGRVTSAEVLTSQPAGVFEQAARRVGRVLQFRPARREGRPVPAVVSFDIVWKVE